jgi:anti-sigma regulatory factor (Ser/Thr protein kinase)
MQSLVHREIQLLDDLEAHVEDPELLKGLFTVDHLATRMRRQSESLAVLGGAVSRRQWSRPVTMHEVLRAAVAEVESYSRVKVAPPVDGVLQGNAVADVIHLIAELIENATKFSAPHTQVLLRAQLVTAGLAVEVEDRGLGMLPADRQRLNSLLADPSRVNVSELLRDGRIGLFVVSSLARRHGIQSQLQSNIFGGTQAVVVLPKTLIERGPREREPRYQEAQPPASQAGLPQRETKRQAVASPAGQRPAIRHPEPEPEPLAPAPAPEPVAAIAPAAPGTAATALTSFAAPSREASLPAAEPSAAAFPESPPSLAPSPAEPPAAVPGDAAGSGRPPLPKRHVQANLAPQLRDAPASRQDQPAPEQISGLMAAFQQGVSRAEEEE